MRKTILTTATLLFSLLISFAQNLPQRLWYDKPATFFEEALPIGNGKLGAMVYGNVWNDNLFLNDLTLWSGQPIDPNEDAGAHKWIPEIRKALFEENYKLADSLQLRVQGHNSAWYQPLSIVSIQPINSQGSSQTSIKNYRRELDLDSALAKVSYEIDGVTYRREYLATYPDRAILVRLTASKPRTLNLRLSLTSILSHQLRVEGVLI